MKKTYNYIMNSIVLRITEHSVLVVKSDNNCKKKGMICTSAYRISYLGYY